MTWPPCKPAESSAERSEGRSERTLPSGRVKWSGPQCQLWVSIRPKDGTLARQGEGGMRVKHQWVISCHPSAQFDSGANPFLVLTHEHRAGRMPAVPGLPGPSGTPSALKA